MPDQSLVRRQETLPVFQQYPVNVPVPTTQAQLEKAANLSYTVLAAKDQTFQQIEAVVNKRGRSYSHQRYIEGQAADILSRHDVAVAEIYRRKMEDIVNNQSKEREREVVTVTRYEEAPPKGVIGYLFGR
jgi:hypothetical protein